MTSIGFPLSTLGFFFLVSFPVSQNNLPVYKTPSDQGHGKAGWWGLPIRRVLGMERCLCSCCLWLGVGSLLWQAEPGRGPKEFPTLAPSVPNVQGFKNLTVCWATAHKYAQPFWVMSHQLWWKWRQMSQQGEQWIDLPFCKSCSTLSWCRGSKKRDSSSI